MSQILPPPYNEDVRLRKLHDYRILDSDDEDMFDNLTRLVARLLNVPTSLISLVDRDRLWFKSRQGMGVMEVGRKSSFCEQVVHSKKFLAVSDALEDGRFKDSPLVTAPPNIRFYAGAPLSDEDGDAIGTLCAIDSSPKEITEDEREILSLLASTVMQLIKLRKRKLEAEELTRAKDEFLSNMSHEIRTPLNAIIGFNDLLRKTALTKEQEDYLNTINASSHNLKVIINDILDVAKLEGQKITLEEKPIALATIIKHVVRLQAPLAKEKGIKLLSGFDSEIPETVLGDETRLTQIFMNLVANAIKFTNEGEVEIRAVASSFDADRVVVAFSVKDTGIGIPKDKQKLIFKRFSQADTSTTRLFGGTGLGLSIVNMLVELHGSTVTVESEPGAGAEFKFTIPFRISRETVGPKATDTTRPSGHEQVLTGISVLLVEDNLVNQLLAKTYLLRSGAEVGIADNGKVAVHMVQQKTFDAVLMDLNMPIMDGYSATSFIREELRMDIPIIGCSAHSMIGEKDKCIAVGMNGYISKPYSEEELIETTLRFTAKG